MNNNIVKYWSRKGFYYYAYIYISDYKGRYNGSLTKTLNFVTYWTIYVFHGRKELERMAADYSALGDI